MKKVNISDFEREYLEEEAEEKYRFYERKFFREHNRNPSKEEKQAFIDKYIQDNAQETDKKLRPAENEKAQIDFLKKLLIHEKKRLTIKEMSEALKKEGLGKGASEKNLYRHIRPTLLQKEWIKRDTDGKYYFDENNRKIKSFREVSERIEDRVQQSIESINIISNFLETIKDSPVYEQAKKFIESEKEGFTRGRRKEFKNWNSSSRIVFLGAPEKDIDSNTWKTIYEALDSNSVINITYLGEGKVEPNSYTVKPYQLIYDNGLWELWGDCISIGHKGKKLFNLSRISHVSIRAMIEKFTLPEDYDFLQTISGSFGCYNDKSKQRFSIKLKKDSYAWLYSKDRIWGENQTVEECEDNFILTFEASQFKPILRWVLGWGDEVEPIEPEELVSEWKNKIMNMSKKITS